MTGRAIACHLLAFCLLSLTGICADAAAPHTGEAVDERDLPQDRNIAAFRTELIELAFDTASAIPVDPHIKDKCRAQEAVVAACLRMDQPRRALRYLRKIDNWRRGLAYADLAFWCVRRGHTEGVDTYLDRAAQAARYAGQQWRKDRVSVRIARVHAWMGRTRQAEQAEAGVEPSEAGKVAGVRAMRAEEGDFDERMEALEKAAATRNFDILKNHLFSATELYNRFYDDADKRTLVEDRIRSAWDPMPIFLRIELLFRLADFAVDHDDRERARELLDDARAMVEGADWPVEYHVKLLGRLAGHLATAGDDDGAREHLAGALEVYEAGRERTLNIERAEILCEVAEAWQATGDAEGALAVYKQAVEEGFENPNARPRALDLSATCCSMALHGVEPDRELWRRLREIRDRLGRPW